MADYWSGYEVAKYLKERNENIVGLAVHPPRMEGYLNRGYTKKIKDILCLPKEVVFEGDDIQSGKHLDKIKALNPDIILTICWGFLLKPELIELPPLGCINMHMAYLPFNRGKNPNVWPIIDGTPAGVTLHYIDAGIDTGDIIAQVNVSVESIDTGQTVYQKIINESVSLFKTAWPKIRSGSAERTPQDNYQATFRYARDLKILGAIDLNKRYLAMDLINILRARTFPPFPSAYFIDENGKKIYIRVQLEQE